MVFTKENLPSYVNTSYEVLVDEKNGIHRILIYITLACACYVEPLHPTY